MLVKIDDELLMWWAQGDKWPLHSLYIDLCFKLNHLTRADIHGDVWLVGSKTPPFSRFFIPDDEVLQHLRQPDSSQAPDESQHVCSDFKADEVDTQAAPPNRVAGAYSSTCVATLHSLSLITDFLTQVLGRRPGGKVRTHAEGSAEEHWALHSL